MCVDCITEVKISRCRLNTMGHEEHINKYFTISCVQSNLSNTTNTRHLIISSPRPPNNNKIVDFQVFETNFLNIFPARGGI